MKTKNFTSSFKALVVIMIMSLCFSTNVFSQALTGIKTIDPAGSGPNNYLTFSFAVADLNANGVGTGGVIFNVVSGGVFNESPLDINITANLPTASNPIVFQNAGVTPTVNFTATSFSLDAGFRLMGTDYITFDGLYINDAGVTQALGTDVAFLLVRKSSTDACQNVTIKNCTIDLTRSNYTVSPGTVGIYESNLNTSYVITQPSSGGGVYLNNTFTKNYILDLVRGISISGSATAGLYDENIAVTSNTVEVGGTGVPSTVSSMIGVFLQSVKNATASLNKVTSGTNNHKTIFGVRCTGSFQGTVTVQSNTISIQADSCLSTSGMVPVNIGLTGTSSEAVYCTNNLIENCTSGVSGGSWGTQLRGIECGTNLGTLLLANNIIRNNACYSPTFSGPNLFGCFNNLWVQQSYAAIQLNGTSLSSGNHTITGNQIYGNTSRSWFTGILCMSQFALVKQNDIYNNGLINAPVTGDNKMVTGVFYYGSSSGPSTCNATITANNIHDLYTDASSIAEVSGIKRYYDYAGTSEISDNTIYNLTSENSVASGIHAWLQSGCLSASSTLNINIYRNKIYNVTSNAAASAAYGIYTDWLAGGNFSITPVNNMISNINAPNTSNSLGIVGMYLGKAVKCTAYFNTFSLTANTGIGGFGSAGVYAYNTGTNTCSLDMRSNLISNNSTAGSGGFITAFQTSAAGLTFYNTSSNGNLFYAGTPSTQNLLFNDGGTNPQQTISGIQTLVGPTRDAISISSNVVMFGQNDMHTSDAIVNNKGVWVSGYTTDLDNQARVCSPDIGADEFSFTNNAVNVNTSASPICVSASATLSATGNNATSFSWMPGNLSGASVVVNPSSSTIYTVTATFPGGCTVANTILQNVSLPPNITVNSGTIIPGQSFTMVPGGGISYSYSPSGPVVTPPSTSSYTVTGADANGCTNTVVSTVFMHSTHLSSPYCGYTSTSTTEFIWADSVGTPSTMSNYRYKFKLINGSTTLIWQTNNEWPIMQFYLIPGYTPSTSYTTSVAWSGDNGNNFSVYGSTCVLTSPALVTQLSQGSCGSSPASYNTLLYANQVPGATQYEYRLINSSLSYTQTLVKTNNNFILSQFTGLQYNTTYAVTVRVFINNAWGAYGSACNVTTPGAPSTQLSSGSCGSSPATYNTLLFADAVNGATQYEYRLINTSLSYTQTFVKFNNNFVLSQFTGLQNNTTYAVTVRIFMNNTWGAYGSSCNVTTPGAPTTQLESTSCNITATSYTNQLIKANLVGGATQYEFKLTNASLTYNQTLVKSNNNFLLSQFAGLQNATTYSVEVRVYFNNAWGTYGSSCDVTTPSTWMRSLNSEEATIVSTSANLDDIKFSAASFPNPYADHFGLKVETRDITEEITITVFDMTGKKLEQHSVSPNRLHELQIGSGYSKGVYNVVVNQGKEMKTMRVIKD